MIPSPTAAGDFTRRLGETGVIELMECVNAVRPAVVAGPGPGPAGAGGLRGRGRDAGADAGRQEGGDGQVLQGGVGLPSAGRVAGQHGRGAVPREPPGQRGEPLRRGGVDRPGGRLGGAARREGVRAQGHGLLADGQLRPLERRGGLHLRLRRPAGDDRAGRGAGGRRVGSAWSGTRGMCRRRGRRGAGGRT